MAADWVAKACLPKGSRPGDHEEGVVGHEVEDGGGVAGFGGGHPGGDELANGLFVL
jgi:hypothetical protein